MYANVYVLFYQAIHMWEVNSLIMMVFIYTKQMSHDGIFVLTTSFLFKYKSWYHTFVASYISLL